MGFLSVFCVDIISRQDALSTVHLGISHLSGGAIALGVRFLNSTNQKCRMKEHSSLEARGGEGFPHSRISLIDTPQLTMSHVEVRRGQ